MHHLLLGFVCLIAMHLVLPGTRASAQVPDTEAITAAIKFLSSTILSRCGDSYYAKKAMGSFKPLGRPDVHELYRIVQVQTLQRIEATPERLSDADRLHQVEWKGLLVMESPQRVYTVTYLTILRGQSPTWSSWTPQRLVMRAVKQGGRWDVTIVQGNYGLDAGSQPLNCAAIPHQDR
jgi:hypothetical protein